MTLTMKELLEAGAHFGHKSSRWNPKMRPFIFTERAGIHIFDLEITLNKFMEALDEIKKLSAEGKTILFVATKKQAQAIVKNEATRANMPYVVERWMGGTLTNFKTLHERIKRLKELEDKKSKNEFKDLTKKERLMIDQEIELLNKTFEGIKNLDKAPDALFVIDVVKESLAIKEANKLGLEVIGICDSNANPDTVNLAVPANDDALRAIQLYAKEVADAVLAGRAMAEKRAEKESEPVGEKELVKDGD